MTQPPPAPVPESVPEPEGAPRQPWLHELSICVNGNVTALSAPSGQIGADGAQGVFVDDRRVVSVLEVRLGAEPAVPVAHASAGARSDFFGSARHLGNPGADPTVEVLRHREVVTQGVREVVEVVSRADAPVETELVVRLGGDGLPIGTVKSGLVAGSSLPVRQEGSDLVWADDWHEVRAVFDPAPEALDTAGPDPVGAARFSLRVAPGGRESVTMLVTARRLQATSFDAGSGAALVDWSAVSVEGADPRLTQALDVGLDDLRHLLLTDPEQPTDVFTGAGTPWYLTLFGRDSLWAARMLLPFGTELAAGTLRALARRQGRVLDDSSAEAPGKIPHEQRRAGYADPSQGLALPPVYYGTIDATPLWVALLHDAWRWGMPAAEVEALLPNLRAAVGWLTGYAAPDEDGLLKYIDRSGSGLANQGWKDSGDSMRWRDGRIADAPIALLEAQAYAVEAAECAATLYEALGEDGAPALREWAAAMRTRVRERFWVDGPDGRYLGMAVDAHGGTVDGVGSNMGHVLGTGTLDAQEAARVAATLTSPTMLGRYGVATLASDNGGYNPIGYHTGSIWTHDTAICALGLAREGHTAEAARVGRSLLESAEAFDYRWPELYAGSGVLDRPAPYPASCRPQAWSAASAAALISVALGFEPDAPAGRLTLRPARPAAYGPMTVRGLRFAGHTFGVEVGADGSATVLDAPAGIAIEVV